MADVEQFVEDELLPSEQKTLKIRDSGGRKMFSWNSARTGDPQVHIHVRDDRVVLIGIYPEFTLTLEDVIERYGIPDGFCARGSVYGGCCEVKLYYLQHGLVLHGDTDRLGDEELVLKTKIEPGTRIKRVHYFEPGDWGHYFIDGSDIAQQDMNFEVRVKGFRSWPGFREFNIPIDGGCGPDDVRSAN